jgi:ribosomal protein S18 acetylase RimI-like enzyme
MSLPIEPRHDLSPNEIDATEDRLYDHNSHAAGRHDGQGLGFVIRNEAGQMIGVVAGYTWSGTSELKQMWIDEAYRGRGHARALLNAFVAEARRRGVRRIWVASHDFPAPEMYEKAGFKRTSKNPRLRDTVRLDTTVSNSPPDADLCSRQERCLCRRGPQRLGFN